MTAARVVIPAGTAARAELTPRERRQCAKAVLLLHLAITAGRWADEVMDRGDLRPFDEWSAGDPRQELLDHLALTKPDLDRVLNELADELEARANRAGYDHAAAYLDDFDEVL